VPFNGIPDPAPSRGELSTLSPVPLSGFLNPPAVSAQIKFHGLISCRNRSWTTSLQSFPLAKNTYPSQGRLAPLQLSTVPRKRAASDLITRRFTDSHAFDAVAKIPDELKTTFSTSPKARFPVALGHR
jgi:hypothetical protein